MRLTASTPLNPACRTCPDRLRLGIILGRVLGANVPAVTLEAGSQVPVGGAAREEAFDLSGRPVDPFQGRAKAVVLVFIANDGPISNRYAPEIERLATRFRPHGIVFWLVQPDVDETVAAIRAHEAADRYSLGVLRDPNHVLVRRAHAG